MNQREESLEIQTQQINLWSEVKALGTQMPHQKHKVKYSAAVFPFWFKSLVYIFKKVSNIWLLVSTCYPL